jgi:hypothetical protein
MIRESDLPNIQTLAQLVAVQLGYDWLYKPLDEDHANDHWSQRYATILIRPTIKEAEGAKLSLRYDLHSGQVG